MKSTSLVLAAGAAVVATLVFPASSPSSAAKPTPPQPCELFQSDAGQATPITQVIKSATLHQDITDTSNISNLGYSVEKTYFEAVATSVTMRLQAAPCAGSTYSLLVYRLAPDTFEGTPAAQPIDVTTFRGENLPANVEVEVDALIDTINPTCVGLALQTRNADGDVVDTTQGILANCKENGGLTRFTG